MSERPFDMPPPSASFDARGGWVLNRLVADLGITPVQAAGIVGNLGGESGLQAINEVRPVVPGSRGGFGWAQWTGPRRVQFEAYAAAQGLDVTDDRANYGFLIVELKGSEAKALRQLKKTTTVDAATYTFAVHFERPADPEGTRAARVRFAERALAAAAVPPAETAPEMPPIPALPEPIPILPPETYPIISLHEDHFIVYMDVRTREQVEVLKRMIDAAAGFLPS